MALLKDIKTIGGAELAYWRLEGVFPRPAYKECIIYLMGYKTQQHRVDFPMQFAPKEYSVSDHKQPAANGEPIEVNDYSEWFSPAALEASGNNIYEQAFAYLSSLPEFAGAVNVLEA